MNLARLILDSETTPVSIRLGLSFWTDPERRRRYDTQQLAIAISAARGNPQSRRAQRRLRRRTLAVSVDCHEAADALATRIDVVQARLRADSHVYWNPQDQWIDVPWLSYAVASVMVVGWASPDAPRHVILIVVVLGLLATFTSGALGGQVFGTERALWVLVEDQIRQEQASAVGARAAIGTYLFPRFASAPSGTGFLYVIAFSTGAVKVGQTTDLNRRLRDHRRDAAAFNVSVVAHWVSPAHTNFLANETRLIAACARRSARTRHEYFHDLTFADAVELVKVLPLAGEVR